MVMRITIIYRRIKRQRKRDMGMKTIITMNNMNKHVLISTV